MTAGKFTPLWGNVEEFMLTFMAFLNAMRHLVADGCMIFRTQSITAIGQFKFYQLD